MEFQFALSGCAVTLDDQIIAWTRQYASSMMDSNELTHLAATLVAYPWQEGEFVVEIGAYVGQTTVFMAKVLQRSGKPRPILSIDPFERFQPNPYNPQGVYSAYVANVLANQLSSACLPLACFSSDAALVVAENIGVLVVDGDHSHEAALQDLELFSPKLRPGGFMFIDDYGAAYPGVVQAVNEFLAGHPEFILHAQEYFAVLQRPL